PSLRSSPSIAASLTFVSLAPGAPAVRARASDHDTSPPRRTTREGPRRRRAGSGPTREAPARGPARAQPIESGELERVVLRGGRGRGGLLPLALLGGLL